MKSFENFNEYIQEAVKSYWHDSSLSDYEGSTLQYKDVACLIEKLHILYEKANIKPGDKIALCGRNSAHWAVAFMSILSYGAVAVPILNDFKANQIHDIVNHSEAKLLFAGGNHQQRTGCNANASSERHIQSFGLFNYPHP